MGWQVKICPVCLKIHKPEQPKCVLIIEVKNESEKRSSSED